MAARVVVVILSFNRCADIVACLESLLKSTYRPISVIVVDAGSTDGSVEAIRTRFRNVSLFELGKNLGYAGNGNIGLQLALEQSADWVLILNDDTTLAPDCIECLVRAGDSNPRAGMLGPLIYYGDEINIIQTAGGKLDKFWIARHLGQNESDQGQFSKPQTVDWLSGCALMVRRSVIEQVGNFDERLFMYWEEVDWCLSAREHGFELLLAPQAKVWHKGVQRNSQPQPAVTYYSVRNHFLVLEKHRAPFGVRWYTWAQTLRTFASWSLRPKWRHMREHRDALGQAVSDYVFGRWGMRVT